MKKIITLLMITMISLFITGCDKSFKEEDVKKYVRDNLGLKDYTIGNTERVGEGEYSVYWKIKDNKNDVDFYVREKHKNGLFGLEGNLTDDYNIKLFINRYDDIKNTYSFSYDIITPEDFPEYIDNYRIKTEFNDEDELKTKYEEAVNIDKYYKSFNKKFNDYYVFIYKKYPDLFENYYCLR